MLAIPAIYLVFYMLRLSVTTALVKCGENKGLEKLGHLPDVTQVKPRFLHFYIFHRFLPASLTNASMLEPPNHDIFIVSFLPPANNIRIHSFLFVCLFFFKHTLPI